MEEPITLVEACKLYPRSRLTVSTLRAEAARRRLEIFRLESATTLLNRPWLKWCVDAAKKITAETSTSMRQEANGYPRRTTLCTHGLR